ncbi:hypothetical protein G6F16_007103 [Rhizopus arrhizus]|nr:hypothetical protein G6F24_005607 [Rhizopus arrhizus]KAG0810651.1 hypothetical protein G6F20_007785 [Rhizopus arrhizus]KAG0853910.1 hypothetical protein G6F17_006807 [Rhizopus arrhizus]KAG0869727.1 hypothetical protein G6F16_007103 [Rhizopus arrhizus]KAG0895423.1 hypothetical protein G6F34_008244 [Rhizopus arrhizus]
MRYETTAIKQYNISNSYKKAIKNIIQSTNRNHMLESIEVLRSAEGSAVEKKALVDFFMLFCEEIYDDVGDTLSESEACLNSNLIKPCLQVCSRMLRNKNMADDLISYVRSHLNLTELLRETLDSIEGLQKEHRSQLQEVTINNEQISAETLLSSVVKPVIIRLNEGQHSKEVVDSPRSSSNSPQR